jgi:hypothetical protein
VHGADRVEDSSMSMTFVDLLAISAAIAGATAEPTYPLAVDVRSGGHDGLTQRFAVDLETALRRSRLFTLSSRGRPARLVFEIPRSLRWTEIDSRVQVHFQVNFKTRDTRVIGRSIGTCWETNLDVCVALVVSDARRVSGNLRR